MYITIKDYNHLMPINKELSPEDAQEEADRLTAQAFRAKSTRDLLKALGGKPDDIARADSETTNAARMALDARMRAYDFSIGIQPPPLRRVERREDT